jgi:hypothetical protein
MAMGREIGSWIEGFAEWHLLAQAHLNNEELLWRMGTCERSTGQLVMPFGRSLHGGLIVGEELAILQ